MGHIHTGERALASQNSPRYPLKGSMGDFVSSKRKKRRKSSSSSSSSSSKHGSTNDHASYIPTFGHFLDLS